MGAAALPYIIVASAGLQAVSSIQQGNAQAAAAEFERVQYEDQRKVNQIQALDEESERRRKLNQVLASNRASAASMGVGSDGRSFLAIQDDSKAGADRDIGRIRLNAANTNRSLSLSADQSAMAGKAARRGGYIGAGTSLLQGAYQYGQLKKA